MDARRCRLNVYRLRARHAPAAIRLCPLSEEDRLDWLENQQHSRSGGDTFAPVSAPARPAPTITTPPSASPPVTRSARPMRVVG